MIKLSLTFIGLIVSLVCCYGQLSQTANVTQAGSLSTVLGDNKTKVTDLTLTGTINDQDFATIKQMSALKNLDMSEVSIVNGAIPASAFAGRSMDSMVLPTSLKTIGNLAFYGTKLSQKLELPVSLISIGIDAFRECNVNKLDFSKSANLTTLASGVFWNLKQTEGDTLDFSLNAKLVNFNRSFVGGGTFYKYTGHVILPRNMKTLPSSSFATFYGTVDLPEGLEVIGDYAFYESSIKLIELPSSLTHIGQLAFYGTKLSQKLELPVSLISIGIDAFRECNVDKLDFSKSANLTTLASGVFWNLKQTEGDTLDFSLNAKLVNFNRSFVGGGTFYKYTGHVILPRNMKTLPPSSFATFYGTVDLPEGLEVIGDYAFYESSIKLIELPSSLTHIGQLAFYGTKLSQKLELPVSLISIGIDAFRECNVDKLDFSKSANLTTLASGVFWNLKQTEGDTLDFSLNAKLVNFNRSFVGGGTFYKYTGHVILPRNMKTLPPSSFATFYGTVDLPEGLEVIGDYAFYESSIKLIELPSSLTHIGQLAFYGTKLSQKLELPVSLISIGIDAFRECNVDKLDFSKSANLTTLASGVFWNLKQTEGDTLDFSLNAKLVNFNRSFVGGGTFYKYTGHVILPRNMKTLPPSSFATFYGTVDLPEGLEVIGDYAFYESSIKLIELPSSLTHIGQLAFYGTKLSQKLELPVSLISIGIDAFRECNVDKLDFSKSANLTTLASGVFWNLKQTEGDTLDFSLNAKLVNFNRSFVGGGTFYKYTGHVILPRNMKILPSSSFATFYGTVDLPEGLETIRESAFYDSSIKSVELPSSVTNIEGNAFYNCTSLEYIISKNVTPPVLGTNVFYNVNKTTCILYVPSDGLHLYQVANQWKDFLISPLTFDIRLNQTNLYSVNTDKPFTVKVPVYMASGLHLGLYSLNGSFVEDITQLVNRDIVTCQTSIDNGSYIIQPFKLENGERKVISRSVGSFSIDRLLINVVNNWNIISSRSANTNINNNILFDTGTPNLLEVANGKEFNVLVRHTNVSSSVRVGLFDVLNGTLVVDVTESVKGNNFTCKVPFDVETGNYNLIPYELVSGKPVFVERSVENPYLVDRLPLSVASAIPTTSKVLVESTFGAETSISVYPNPTTDVINVAGDDVQQVLIYDLTGRQVLKSTQANAISVNNLSNGTYIVKVKTSKGETSHKIIKK